MHFTLLVSWTLLTSTSARAADWQQTIDAVAPAVVSIRVTATRSFDTESAGSSVATGFVVDAERGILLTNRHVVQPGPVVAEAVLLDHEELAIEPIYRDPVHDFGFYRFDPADVHYQDLPELELHPEGARVGVDIRVIGNDAGEKLSILAGTLARLDRPAPEYGRGNFNDFNTFYLQAASGTSGGSSGSPVIDQAGRVVALNAGSRRSAASSYFLPLDRVVRALALVQAGQPVTRGTLQLTLDYTPYDEVRRLGLRPETEDRVRAERPKDTGMLVVEQVVPGGPAFGALEPGDVLCTVDGALVTSFVEVEAVLDDRVGQEVLLGVERGGQPVEVTLVVGDLHSVTPDSFLDAGGGTLNELSYQVARSYAVPVGGPYLAASGYSWASAGLGRGAVFTAVGDQATPDLDSFEQALAALPDGEPVPVRYRQLQDPGRERVAVLRVDRRWFPMQRCTRDDADGDWPCVASPQPPAAEPAEPAVTTFEVQGPRAARRLARSLCMVDFDIPYRNEGVYGAQFRGTGLVVDAERGLVLVDRDTVPVALGDATLTFAGTVEVPASVVGVHPTLDVAMLQYDPALLDGTRVRTARFDTRPLEVGDRVWQIGLHRRQEVVFKRAHVERIDPILLPEPSPPFFKQTNLEVLSLDDATSSSGGVFASRKGEVRALWASFASLAGKDPDAFFRGIPADVLVEAVDDLRSGRPIAILGAELVPILLADARNRGLSEERARSLETHDPRRRQVLSVDQLTAGAPAAGVLREGDLIVAIDGRPVTTFREVDAAVERGAVHFTVFRDGGEQDLVVEPMIVDTRGTDRIVVWSGTVLHEPHLAVSAQRGIPPEGVYVAWYWYGSPAGRYGPRPTRRIVEVDGTPTPDLDAFLAAVAHKADGEAVRLRTLDLDGRPDVITLKVDTRYWPTLELVHTEQGWVRRDL